MLQPVVERLAKAKAKTQFLLCLIGGWPLANRRSPALARQHAKGTPTPDKPDPWHQPPAGKWRCSENSTVGAALCLSLPPPPFFFFFLLFFFFSSFPPPCSSLPRLPHCSTRGAASPRSPSAARRLPLFTSRRGLNIDTDFPSANRWRRWRPAPTPLGQWEAAGGRGAGQRRELGVID